MKAPRPIKIGDLVRVRCTCGKHNCKAPAREGGALGEVVELKDKMAVVHLDNEPFPLDFPAVVVRAEH